MTASLRTNTLSFQEAHEWFYYDRDTGKLHWKLRPSKSVKWGAEAGCVHASGYIKLRLKGKEYRTHNIIWTMQGNKLPANKTVDHIDQRKHNNRIENLRLADGSQQLINKISRGFHWDKQKQKWRAQFQFRNKLTWLGYFKTALQARLAYERYTSDLEPEFASTAFTDVLRELCSDGY